MRRPRFVIDANEGVQENSRQHGYMMSMLGKSAVAVLVNKMDLVGYDRALRAHRARYRAFPAKVGVNAVAFIPVAGRDGDNIVQSSKSLSWYSGPTVLEALDAFPAAAADAELPFRMPVQDVYKFTNKGDDRRLVAGTVESGTAHAGDEIVFYPSGKRSRIKTLEAFNHEPPVSISAGEATGFTLQEQIYVARGELAASRTSRDRRSAPVARQSLLARPQHDQEEGLPAQDRVLARVGAAREVHRVIDASNGVYRRQGPPRAAQSSGARWPASAIAFDLADAVAATNRFVVSTPSGSVVAACRESLQDRQDNLREKVLLRVQMGTEFHRARAPGGPVRAAQTLRSSQSQGCGPQRIARRPEGVNWRQPGCVTSAIGNIV